MSNAQAPKVEATAAANSAIAVGSSVYNEIVEFLYREAALLDNVRVAEWSQLLAEDLIYTAPIRMTRKLADRDASVVRTTQHFDDTYTSILGRIGRLTNTKSAWAEDPPSRTRRFVSNVLVSQTAAPDEYEVVSYLLLIRSRFEDTNSQISAERRDLLRKVPGGFKLARREIILDQSVLAMSNLAVFL